MPYDFLINATGPALRFDKTEGLGPDGGNSLSVCLPGHAAQAAAALAEEVERMRRGERRRFLVGVGHGTCTCEGAAFEYIVNLEFELRNRGVRDRAEITWITNEYELGDFGMGGMHLKRAGYVTPSSIFNASLFAERGIDWITRAHVQKVEPDRVLYETLDGTEGEQEFDFAMLLPPFSGVGLKAFDRDGARSPSACSCPTSSCASTPTTPQSRMRSGRHRTGRAPTSHRSTKTSSRRGSRSRRRTRSRVPRTSPNGTLIAPAPPRTGMPSAMIGKAVASSIVDMIGGAKAPTHTASMAEMGAACVASAGAEPVHRHRRLDDGLPDRAGLRTLPRYGRDQERTFGEIGLAGHWIKILLHHLFLYKARLRPGWRLIPGVVAWTTRRPNMSPSPRGRPCSCERSCHGRLWRFAVINLKMIGIIRRSHGSRTTGS